MADMCAHTGEWRQYLCKKIYSMERESNRVYRSVVCGTLHV